MEIMIDGSKVGLSKNLEVSNKMKNVRLCLKSQIAFAKVDQAVNQTDVSNDETVINAFQRQLDLFEQYSVFLKQIYGLTTKQVQKLDDVELPELTDFVTETISKVLGYDQSKSEK